jgi:hypothetical protein
MIQLCYAGAGNSMTRSSLLLLALACGCQGANNGRKSTGASAASAAPSAASSASPPAAIAPAASFAFEGDAAGGVPAGLSFGRTGAGTLGRWVVKSEPGSPSGTNVLAQLDADATNFRFPVAVATTPRAIDVRCSVRCKMVSGRVDRACGLVARYTDPNNYLLTRANALENNIRVYTVKDRRREELASADVRVSAGAWHAYRFEIRGDRLEVFWDGQRVLEHRSPSIAEPGSCGVWTKADSVTYFDDLLIETL